MREPGGQEVDVYIKAGELAIKAMYMRHWRLRTKEDGKSCIE
jgi:hypothetical protein